MNGELKFLYWKNSFLTRGLRRMLWNVVTEPHFIMHALHGTRTLM